MKKAFTLLELMVVIGILSLLMAIVFRLIGVGGGASARATTVNRMQRVENCLSGYYAVYGSYPPVPMKDRAARDIFRLVDQNGHQLDDPDQRNEGELVWGRVQAACEAQPFVFRFPFPESRDDDLNKIGQMLIELAGSGDLGEWASSGLGPLPSGHLDSKHFDFGVMSFLLPRFIVIAGCETEVMDSDDWRGNNSIPASVWDGSNYSSWSTFSSAYADGGNHLNANYLSAIPSQNACRRWLPNLKGLISSAEPISLLGVRLTPLGAGSIFTHDKERCKDMSGYYHSNRYSVGGSKNENDGGSQPYLLNFVTVSDGWGNTFYYYSPKPYQTYQLWSAGENGKTFPPWTSMESLPNNSMRKTAGEWRADDIIHMNSK